MARHPGTTQDELRRHNVSMLLREVHLRGALSRAELTRLMGLNRSTIKALVSELGAAGLVTERIPVTRSGAGRPSHVVLPRADAVYVLAANVGVDTVSVAVVGLGGGIICQHEYHTDAGRTDVGSVAARLAEELAGVRGRMPPRGRLTGVGVGLPGTVRRADGHVEQAPNLDWLDVPFGLLLTERLGWSVPLRIGNDADLGALAEHLRGVGRGTDDMIYLAGDVGVGGGILSGGRTIGGSLGYAGEIGHMIVNPRGRRCRCGSRGCFETEVGEEAILLACGRDPGGGRQSLREVLCEARAGDTAAAEGLRRVARWLSRGIASLVNIFNPDLVILGGSLSALFQVCGPAVQAGIDRLALGAAGSRVRLVASGLGQDSSLLGAAELAFEHMLRDPVNQLWHRPD